MMNENVLEETGVKGEPTQPQPNSIEDLENELRECEEREDYERAAEIQEMIEKLKGKQ